MTLSPAARGRALPSFFSKTASTEKLKEYLDDVNKYIKDQLKGLDVTFPGVFNVTLEADDENDNSIISLELGSGTNTIITKINCKEEC